MNHFDFTGPAFLLFYAVFSALVIGGLVVARRLAESSAAPKLDLSDPYLIAYLRGGEPETMRVAVVSLIDRGLLVATGSQLERADRVSPSSVRRPIENWLLRKFEKAGEASSIYSDSSLQATCKVYEQTLKNAGLLPSREIQRARVLRLLLAWILLVAVGFVKINIALETGHWNVIFLFILMIIAVIVATLVSFPRLTEQGKAMIADLKNLYSGLKDRAVLLKPGGATIEPMMLAAVFGVGALESSSFAFTRVLFPRAIKKQEAGSDASSSGCGSVACSACGSSCGSSCGGGGCGGGCGGCGG